MIVGIDPGVTGALGVIDRYGDYVDVIDMPVMSTLTNFKKTGNRKTKKKVDGSELRSILLEIQSKSNRQLKVFMEMQAPMPGQGSNSGFSIGHTLGTIEGVLQALSITYHLFSPMDWKKYFKLTRKNKEETITVIKERSMMLVRQLHPNAPIELKKHHNRAEALLIATYGRITY